MRRLPIALVAGVSAALALFAALPTNTSAAVVRTSHSMRADTARDSARVSDPILRLQARIDSGVETFHADSVGGYLASLLRALRIPTSSQSLVFSRTSLQTDMIAPWSPRALYFNDDVYIGFVPESNFLEIATVTDNNGAAFYLLTQDSKPPRFTTETMSCLMCHKSPANTAGVAGFTMLSTLSDKEGYAISSVHTGATTDATPLDQRFGGWYVTGTLGPMHHSGNVRSALNYGEIADKYEYRKAFPLHDDDHRASLDGLISTKRYLETTSDVVALMTLVHQTSVHNLIAILHTTAVHAIDEDAIVSRYLGDTLHAQPLESTNAKLRVAVNTLVRAMLFADEPPLAGGVSGTSRFATEFASRGPRDARGRSLRDFDLEHRLFKYPLSFLIYSEGFDHLPTRARGAVYRKLLAVLNGDDPEGEYAKLSTTDRKAILEILTATKPEFAAGSWR